ncbi:hypothetical protein HK101_010091 [Irineochytrium annulatum]|nr:hypothetical protein HK101_010091 [Irineochytrium annulatum]
MSTNDLMHRALPNALYAEDGGPADPLKPQRRNTFASTALLSPRQLAVLGCIAFSLLLALHTFTFAPTALDASRPIYPWIEGGPEDPASRLTPPCDVYSLPGFLVDGSPVYRAFDTEDCLALPGVDHVAAVRKEGGAIPLFAKGKLLLIVGDANDRNVVESWCEGMKGELAVVDFKTGLEVAEDKRLEGDPRLCTVKGGAGEAFAIVFVFNYGIRGGPRAA